MGGTETGERFNCFRRLKSCEGFSNGPMFPLNEDAIDRTILIRGRIVYTTT